MTDAQKLSTHAPASLPAWLTSLPIAHRGLHLLPDTPENSLAAFRDAAKAGYPAEMDVRLLSDGAVAVFHDNTLDRLTGATGKLETRTTGDLSQLFLLGTSETIPLLITLLADMAGSTPLLIEIKSEAVNPVGPLEDALIAVLDTYDGPFALQSFRAETVVYLKKVRPGWTVGQLASNDDWAKGETFDQPERPFDFLAYNLNVLPTPLSTALHDAGVPLIAWTVASEAGEELAAQRADNFIFDHVRPKISVPAWKIDT